MFTFPCSFTTVENVLEALPVIGSVTNITSNVIAAFIGRSEALINAKISRQYAIPVSGDVPLLQTLALDIAIYNLLAKRVFVGEQLSKSPWPDRYKEALETLDEIASGELQLVGVDGTVVEISTENAGQVWSNTMDFQPTTTEDDQTLQLVDSFKIEVTRGDR